MRSAEHMHRSMVQAVVLHGVVVRCKWTVGAQCMQQPTTTCMEHYKPPPLAPKQQQVLQKQVLQKHHCSGRYNLVSTCLASICQT